MNSSEQIDELIARAGKIIRDADPEVIEEWKWIGTPTFSHDGIFAIVNANKDHVKMTFSHGASLPEPQTVFNSMLKGSQWRAIDFYEGDKIKERALKNLIRSAITFNTSALKRKTSKIRSKAKRK